MMKMANTMTYELGSAANGNGWFGQVRRALADYRLYRQTIGELEQLSSRELRDLGLSRFAIRQVAYDSVYGA
jgi:uncharacterized protein YjiS (DUF1127 family)